MVYIIDNFSIEDEDYGKKGNNLKILSELFENDNEVIVPQTITLTCELYNKIKLENKKENFLDYRKIEINPEITELVLNAINDKFGDKKIVIRSSATCEDSIFFSASGQYDSFLNISGNDKIMEAIKRVYASLFSKNSHLYSKIYETDLDKESMAVLIQDVAPVIKSGVMFSCDPTNYEDKYIIESTKGLGTNVVEGMGKITNLEITKDEFKEIKDPEIKGLINSLEKIKNRFNHNVDVEWGIDKEGKIYIFQARPIIHRDNKITIQYAKDLPIAKGMPISEGFNIGKISDITSPENGTFLYQNEQISMNDIELLLTNKGVILRNNTKLSHFANVLRELAKPCIYIDDFKYIKDKVYAINAYNGDVIDFDNLSTKDKITMLKEYFNYLKTAIEYSYEKHNGIDYINNDDKYEQVVFDIDEVDILARLCALGFKKEIIHQLIYTYDLKDRSMIDYSTIFRIQVSNGNTQVQLKILDSSNPLYRKEEGIILHFNSLEKAQAFMHQFNMEETGFQERIITKYVNNDISVNIIKWPGCPPYLGIEVNDINNFQKMKELLNLDNCLITNWGGKQIFEKLELDIKECKFVRRKKK